MPGQLEAERLTAAIQRGIVYIGRQQVTDGGFVSQVSRTITPFRPEWTWPTNFVPSLILNALAAIGGDEAVRIKNRLAEYLLAQRNNNTGSFNYWSNRARQRYSMPYPDDLDDTFCALCALYCYEPSLIDERVLAQVVKLLVATESTVGGPYRTWLVPKDSEPVWLDIDLAANANVAYFFALLGHQLPNLTVLLDTATAQNVFRSPYYPSEYPILYYLSRAYYDQHQTGLLAIVRRLRRPTGLNPLETAICVSSSCRMGSNSGLKQIVNRLLRNQNSDGSWPVAAFCIEPSFRGKPRYGGAASLTTALVCEALQLYSDSFTAVATDKPGLASRKSQNSKKRVLILAQQQLRTLSPEVKREAGLLLDKQAASSSGPEILGLPYQIAADLIATPRPHRQILDNLAMANLYGWSAYTVYDDFMDDEGQPVQLPAANIAMRYSLSAFDQAVADSEFGSLVRSVFDRIDGANAWELTQCRWMVQTGTITIGRLPDYGNRRQLADRSLGHALPALAVLWLAGGREKRRQIEHMTETLTHYLIVRQLNDDLHDWTDDLEHGHISYVVSSLLTTAHVRTGESVPCSSLIANLRPLFWDHTLPGISSEMRRHLNLSRQSLQKITMLQSDNSVNRLLDSLELTVSDTLQQQASTRRFLKYYRQSAGKTNLEKDLDATK